MGPRKLILGSVLLLTACTGVELAESGTEANSKVPVSIAGYDLVTPAMASSGFCEGVPAIEGHMYAGSSTSSSTFVYIKEGFTLPTSDEPFDCLDVVKLGINKPGLMRISAFEYPEGATADDYDAKCEYGSGQMDGQIFCAFPEANYTYSVITMRIGSLESQNRDLAKFVESFDKHAALKIPRS